MSALVRITDSSRTSRHVRKVPFPDSCIAAKQTLFDHFVRAGEHRCRQIEAERLGGFQIDHQLVLGRRLHRQISRLRSGPYQRSHGPCRSGPNVSVLFVQSSDEVAGRSSPGLGLSQIGRQMPALLSFTFLDLKCGSASSRAVPPV